MAVPRRGVPESRAEVGDVPLELVVCDPDVWSSMPKDPPPGWSSSDGSTYAFHRYVSAFLAQLRARSEWARARGLTTSDLPKRRQP